MRHDYRYLRKGGYGRIQRAGGGTRGFCLGGFMQVEEEMMSE